MNHGVADDTRHPEAAIFIESKSVWESTTAKLRKNDAIFEGAVSSEPVLRDATIERFIDIEEVACFVDHTFIGITEIISRYSCASRINADDIAIKDIWAVCPVPRTKARAYCNPDAPKMVDTHKVSRRQAFTVKLGKEGLNRAVRIQAIDAAVLGPQVSYEKSTIRHYCNAIGMETGTVRQDSPDISARHDNGDAPRSRRIRADEGSAFMGQNTLGPVEIPSQSLDLHPASLRDLPRAIKSDLTEKSNTG